MRHITAQAEQEERQRAKDATDECLLAMDHEEPHGLNGGDWHTQAQMERPYKFCTLKHVLDEWCGW